MHLFLLQSKSSRNIKYKDYFVDEDQAQHVSEEEEEEEEESAPEGEDDEDEDMDEEDFEEYVHLVVLFFNQVHLLFYCFWCL